MKFKIIPMTIDHYNALFAVWERCEGIGLREHSDSLEGIRLLLLSNPGMNFVSTNDDKVVGSVLCGCDGRRGYIYHLAVDPGCRRQGIGRRLVERCLNGLKNKNIEKCHIFVFNTNHDGIAFWESLGWALRRDISVMSKSVD